MSKQTKTLKLPTNLDLVEVVPFKKKLVDALAEYSEIEVDASKVVTATTPFMQLLLAACFEAEKTNIQFKIVNISKPLKAAIVDLGLEQEIKFWSSAA